MPDHLAHYKNQSGQQQKKRSAMQRREFFPDHLLTTKNKKIT
jgi:hypothetical protein